MTSISLLLLLLSLGEANAISLKTTLTEGDIVYDKRFEILTGISTARSRRDTLSDRKFLWKDGLVAYAIAKDMSVRGRKVIRRAFREITKRTCIRFIPKQSYHKDYILFVNGKGCFSSIGRVGGRQVVSLQDDCKYRGKVIHEILHALGFFHEHSRSDRDKYIKVIWRNIKKGMRRNFVSYKHGPIDTLDEPYDYQSIMHYDNKAFSKNGGDTLRSIKNPKMKLGQIKRLSKIDVSQIIKLYNCKVRAKSTKDSCVDLRRYCKLRSSKSNVCEDKYKFMKELCPKSCGFCGPSLVDSVNKSKGVKHAKRNT